MPGRLTETLWGFADQSGTIATWAKFNAAGDIDLRHKQFDTFGKVEASSLLSAAPVFGSISPVLMQAETIFQGWRRDPITEMFEVDGRLYDPVLSRFTTPGAGAPFHPLNALGFLPTIGFAGTLLRRTRLTPRHFGLQSIADDARLLAMWDDSIAELRSGLGANGKPVRDKGKWVRKYLGEVEQGFMPDGETARKAFDSVRGQFITKMKAAVNNGERFAGYRFDDLHHWNWDIGTYSLDAINPRVIFPTNMSMHKLVHTRTTIGPIVGELDMYLNPIDLYHQYLP